MTSLDYPFAYAEVDLNAIAHNVSELRRITSSAARLMAVVKANAYGHGLKEVARKALQNGAAALGVARIDEGIQLRKAGLDAPVLIFGHTPPTLAHSLVEFDLTQTVFSYKSAESLSRTGIDCGKKIKVHLKVDTGMGRLGLLPDSARSYSPDSQITGPAIPEVESIARLPNLELEGIYTHFATADISDKSYAQKQFGMFMDFLNQLRRAGLEIPLKHAANSGAIIDMPETHLDMVRAGI